MPLIFLFAEEEKGDDRSAWYTVDYSRLAVGWKPTTQNESNHLCKRYGATILGDRSLLQKIKLPKDEFYWVDGCVKSNGQNVIGYCFNASTVCVINGTDGYKKDYDTWSIFKQYSYDCTYIMRQVIVMKRDDVTTIPISCAKMGAIPARVTVNTNAAHKTGLTLFGYMMSHSEHPSGVKCNYQDCYYYDGVGEEYPFVCERTKKMNNYLKYGDNCDQMGYKRHGKNCYAFYYELFTAGTGTLMCEASGAQMLNFKDPRHKDYLPVLSLYAPSKSWWTLNDDGSVTSIYFRAYGLTVEQDWDYRGYSFVVCWYAAKG